MYKTGKPTILKFLHTKTKLQNFNIVFKHPLELIYSSFIHYTSVHIHGMKTNTTTQAGRKT
jgi:hypothetical protein